MLIRLTTEQFSALTQSILNERWPEEDSSVSGSCSHTTSSLHHRSSNLNLWIANMHAVISMTESCLFSMQCCLKGPKHHRHLVLIFSFVLCAEISPNSLNLLIISCSVHN